nr:FAD:protein FMN transferase [bacterium]
MRKGVKAGLAAMLATLCMALCACGDSSASGYAMSTWYSLRLTGSGHQETVSKLQETIRLYDYYLNAYDSRSDVWAVNNNPTQRVQVVEEVIDVLALSLEMKEKTDGAFDPGLQPLIDAWNIGNTAEWSVPLEENVQKALAASRLDALEVDRDGKCIQLGTSGAGLDFGGIVKGVVLDAMLQILKEDGITSALLDMGGSIAAVGEKKPGEAWVIGLRHPRGGSKDMFATIKLTDCCVATSGDYERYEVVDGVRYCHILDPKTGAPARSGLISCTIVGPEGAVCDALATASFVLGQQRALELMQQRFPDYGAVLVGEDYTVYTTPGMQDGLQLLDENFHFAS